MNLSLDYDGRIYGFSRDQSGIGSWYCIKGPVAGMTVPAILGSELTKEAVKRGLASYQDLSRQIRKEQKIKTKKVKASGNNKQINLHGGFNPFSFSLENSVKSESEIEVERTLESLKIPSTRRRVVDEEETTEFFSDLFSPDDEEDLDLDSEDIELEFEEVESEVIDG